VEKRLGCVNIIIERQTAPVARVNELISQFGDCVLARLGLPCPTRGANIITLIIEAPVDRLSAFTGKLGQLPGVQVKTLMSKARPAPGEAPDDGSPEH